MGAEFRLHDKSNGTFMKLKKPEGSGEVEYEMPDESTTLAKDKEVKAIMNYGSSGKKCINKPVLITPVANETNFDGFIKLNPVTFIPGFNAIHEKTEY